MKKVLSITLVALLSVIFVVADGYAEPRVLKLGHTLPPTHPAHEAALAIAKEVAEKTNNEIQIEVYPAAQLGGAKDLIEATVRGTQDIGFDGAGVMSQFYPKISVLDMPFMFASYDELLKVYNSEVGQEMRDELLEKRGLRLVGICYYGTRNITSAEKPIRTLEDFKGFKIRTPEVQEWLASFKALGASPTPIAFSEVYFSLQTKVVDGQENPLTTIYTYKFYEVQKYITLSNHQIGSNFLIFNEDVWQSLTPDQQGVIGEAVQKAFQIQNEKIMGQDSELIAELKSKGIEFIELDAATKKELKDVVSAIFPKFEKKWGKGTVEKIQEVLAR